MTAMSPHELKIRLLSYMDAAADLADQMQADLKSGDEYSNETVHCLAKLKAEAEKVQKFVDMLQTITVEYS